MTTLAPTPRTTVYTLASTTDGPFLVGFSLFYSDALEVYVNNIPVTGWTVTASFTGGVSIDAAVTLASPAASGAVVRIDGAQVAKREADYLNGDPNLTSKLNIELAQIWASIQELEVATGRSVKIFSTSTPFAPEAGAAIVWDGAKFISGPTADEIANAQGYAEDAQAAAALITPIADDITTVAGIADDVTTVAGIAGAVTTVTGQAAQIATVAGVADDVAAVAAIVSEVSTVAGIAADVTKVAALYLGEHTTAPAPTIVGAWYLDTSVNPNVGRVWNGTAWITFGISSAATLLAGTALAGLETSHVGGAGMLVATSNKAIGATEPTNPAYWSASETAGGVTFTRVSSDVDPITGNTRVIYDAVGALSAATASFGYVSLASLTDGISNENWTASAFIAVTGPAGGGAGAAQVGTGVRVFQFQNTAGSIFGGAVSGARALSTNTRLLASNNAVRCGVQVVGTTGQAINARIVIEGLQFEKAAARTAGKFEEVSAAQAFLLTAQPGQRLGHVDGEYLPAHDVTSILPLDSTAPLWTEGAHLISVNYVPKKIGSKLLITATLPLLGVNGSAAANAVIYVNEVAERVGSFTPTGTSYNGGITVRHVLTVTSLSSIKVSLRFGPQAGGFTARINMSSDAGGSNFGGKVSTLLTVEEIAQ